MPRDTKPSETRISPSLKYMKDSIATLLRNIGDGRYVTTKLCAGLNVSVPEAAYRLLSMYPKVVYEYIRPLLYNERLSIDALHILAKVFSYNPSSDAFEILVDVYKNFPSIRKEVLALLGIMFRRKGNDVANYNDIVKILSQCEPDLLKTAILAVGLLYENTGNIDIANLLLLYARYDDPMSRAIISLSLGKILRGRPTGILRILKEIISIGNRKTHEIALRTISIALRGMSKIYEKHMPIRKYVSILACSPDRYLRCLAIETLGWIYMRTNDTRIIDLLWRYIKDTDLVKLGALRTLSLVFYSSGNHSTLRLLLKLTGDKNHHVRRYAIKTLGIIFRGTADEFIGRLLEKIFIGIDPDVYKRAIELIFGELNTFRIKVIVLGSPIKDRILGKSLRCEQRQESGVGVNFYSFYDIFNLAPFGTVFVQYVIWSLDMSPMFERLRKLYYLGARYAIIIVDLSRLEDVVLIEGTIKDYWKNSGHKYPIIIMGLTNKKLSRSILVKSSIEYLSRLKLKFGQKIRLYKVAMDNLEHTLNKVFRSGIKELLLFYMHQLKNENNKIIQVRV